MSSASAQVTEHFDDGDIGDGSPATWVLAGPRASSHLVENAFRITGDGGGCCPGISVNLDDYEDIRIETTLQFFGGGGFGGIHFRDVSEQNYWAGVNEDGQLFIGDSDNGDTTFFRSRVFLPTGRIESGDVISLDLHVIGTEISLTAWDEAAGRESSSTIIYDDRSNLRPSGNELGVHFNPNRPNSDRVMDVLSLTYTLLDFDCDGNGVLDVSDLNCSSPSQLDGFLEHTALVKGDANGDGKVAFDDFLTLSTAFGSGGNYTDGDFDLSGKVDFSDFLILSANFGTDPNLSQSVPEPSGHMISLIGIFSIAMIRQRRK